LFYFTVQRGCTITPTSPNDLSATGGVLSDGTQNVTIECECVDDDGTRLAKVRWFFPDNTTVETSPDVLNGSPYRINNKRLHTLVIPTFNDSYDGIYSCGRSDTYPPDLLTTITLTLPGEKYYKLCYSF